MTFLEGVLFSKSLARAILNYHQSDSVSIGLFGEWGSGKASIINMVLEEIEQKPKDKDEELSPIIRQV